MLRNKTYFYKVRNALFIEFNLLVELMQIDNNLPTYKYRKNMYSFN